MRSDQQRLPLRGSVDLSETGVCMTPLLAHLQAERAKYGASLTNDQCAALINAVAWRNRADGWGLSSKPGGNHALVGNTYVAIDVLFHKPSNTVFDVLSSSGEASIPSWNPIAVYDFGGRPWVAPIDPDAAQTVSTVATPSSVATPAAVSVDLSPLRAEIEHLKARLKILEEKPVDNYFERVKALESSTYVVVADPTAPVVDTERAFYVAHSHPLKIKVVRVGPSQ